MSPAVTTPSWAIALPKDGERGQTMTGEQTGPTGEEEDGGEGGTCSRAPQRGQAPFLLKNVQHI